MCSRSYTRTCVLASLRMRSRDVARHVHPGRLVRPDVRLGALQTNALRVAERQLDAHTASKQGFKVGDKELSTVRVKPHESELNNLPDPRLELVHRD